MTNLQIHDVVNVRLPESETQAVHRAVVQNISEETVTVLLPSNEERELELQCIQKRVKLPWKPRDIADVFMVFRRRCATSSNEYVEDLRVRRAMVKRILQLLTREGEWREHHGVQPMHQYYRDFEWLSDAEIEHIFPQEDGVPPGLIMHDYDEEEADGRKGLTASEFTDWLQEGYYDCRIAQHLVHYWIQYLRGTDQDTPADLFASLLRDSQNADSEVQGNKAHVLPMTTLVEFLMNACKFSYEAQEMFLIDDVEDELAREIGREVHLTQAYLSTWRVSGTVAPHAVNLDVGQQLQDTVFPWQRIEEEPTAYFSDARFCKSYPLEMPFGLGDLHQDRVRDDYTTADWVQHKLRYYTGHFLSTIRGQRYVWAVFNTALQDVARQRRSIVHKRFEGEVLTKKDLRLLQESRSDLVSQLASFGADIPTTSMHWRREGNHLQWIVRHMSWIPPWSEKDREHESYVRSSLVHRKKRWEEEILEAENDRKNNKTERFSEDDAYESSENETADTNSVNPELQGAHANNHRPVNASPKLRSGTPFSAAQVWQGVPKITAKDTVGQGRTPAIWYTLNLPYNYLFDIHRFHDAVRRCRTFAASDEPHNLPKENTDHLDPLNREAESIRCLWAVNNPDIIVTMQAIRVGLHVRGEIGRAHV